MEAQHVDRALPHPLQERLHERVPHVRHARRADFFPRAFQGRHLALEIADRLRCAHARAPGALTVVWLVVEQDVLRDGGVGGRDRVRGAPELRHECEGRVRHVGRDVPVAGPGGG